MPVPTYLRWLFAVLIGLLLSVGPYLYYRYSYTRQKRLRVVTPGYMYRSGQMTAAGFRDAVRRYKIRTVINVQQDIPDPEVACGYFLGGTIRESELCRQLGVRYVTLAPDLVSPRAGGEQRPQVIDAYLKIMDDPRSYPVLLHCKAGLHRTGCLIAVYRMEYNGWSNAEALRELKDNGFGRFNSSRANEYIRQYVMDYRPSIRGSANRHDRPVRPSGSARRPRTATEESEHRLPDPASPGSRPPRGAISPSR